MRIIQWHMDGLQNRMNMHLVDVFSNQIGDWQKIAMDLPLQQQYRSVHAQL